MNYPIVEFEKKVHIDRIANLCKNMNNINADWNHIFIVNKVNQYYYTGTMQDGVLVIMNSGDYAFFVRRSIERAILDSKLDNIYEMSSYRDIVAKLGSKMGNAYFELNVMPVSMLERFKKTFEFTSINSVDSVILNQRAVKDEQELEILKFCGAQHKILMEQCVPSLMKEGISETEFVTNIYSEMMKLGFQGLPRYNMFQTETLFGQIAFGTNSLCASNFDGPGGSLGMYAAAPFGGNANRLLKKGDLVFVDVAFAYGGYHTDKTQVYSFGGDLSEKAYNIHKACRDLQDKIASKLKIGAIPSEIYKEMMMHLPDELQQNFMGYGKRTVKFLGHGVGLCVDENPVIANGFNTPLEKGMVIAIEPKCGVDSVGAVGVEETFLITDKGAQVLTGGNTDIIKVGGF